ncbi:hypothetical protein GCM10023144_42140 [Pigmentiphaga soli]|uniref:Low affinity iron permease family protein n=1 Tax=Pigmentiphaga soli TaxID=1007095 RepID=A0ABP8HMK2_9BURK
MVNTGTTIVTFLMVFLIQQSQNKDSVALHLKLDELLASQSGASNQLVNIEELDEQELHQMMRVYARLAERSRRTGQGVARLNSGRARTAFNGCPPPARRGTRPCGTVGERFRAVRQAQAPGRPAAAPSRQG